ncbi:MAG: cation diffusion facilitator family transporter [Candidatus Aureabacteria bacterium]|nr:cation diffusion facilitator family transporter [Candidatus Auribacterota bacterium]
MKRKTKTTAGGGGAKEGTSRAAVIAGGADILGTLLCFLLSHSTVILADFLKTALEFLAVLLSWLAIRRIKRGAKHRYDYGLDKLENLSSLLIGLLMVLCLAVIVFSAVRNLLQPVHIGGFGVALSMVFQVVYSAVNGRLFLKSRRAALAESSPIMAAQARLFQIKAASNVFILAALGASTLFAGLSWTVFIDPVASLVIAASILLAALGIFKSSCCDLLDRTLEETHQFTILKELTRHFDDYYALHGLHSRRAGSQVFVEIYLEFAPDKPAAEVHALAEKLREAIEGKIFHCHASICLAVRPED